MAKDDDDEIIVPKKSKSTSKGSASSGTPRSVSGQMRKLMRVTSAVGILLGGFVTIVSVMAVMGLAIENIWVRLVFGLLIVVGLPAFLADRLLKRSDSTLATRGGLGMVADVFAIVLLGAALMFVAADAVTKSLIRHEGDLYAKSGSTTMARLVYFLAGVTPVFPLEKTAAAKAGATAGGSSSAGGAASPPPK